MIDNKQNWEKFTIKRDDILFLEKDYHSILTKDLKYSSITSYEDAEFDQILLFFEDCLMFFDAISSKKLDTLCFGDWKNEHSRFDKNTSLPKQKSDILPSVYKIFKLAQGYLITSYKRHPVMVTQKNGFSTQIKCFKQFDEVVDITWQKTEAHSLYIMTNSTKIYFVETRPDSCEVKYQFTLPDEVLPIMKKSYNEKLTKTLDFTQFHDILLVFSRNTHKIYIFKRPETVDSSLFTPITLDIKDLLGVDYDSQNQSEISLTKSQEFLYEVFLIKKTYSKNSILTKVFSIQKFIDQIFFEEKEVVDQFEYSIFRFIAKIKIPFYLFMVLICIGVNFWLKKKSKKIDIYQDDNEGNLKDSSVEQPKAPNPKNNDDNPVKKPTERKNQKNQDKKKNLKKSKMSANFSKEMQEQLSNNEEFSKEVEEIMKTADGLDEDKKILEEMLKKVQKKM